MTALILLLMLRTPTQTHEVPPYAPRTHTDAYSPTPTTNGPHGPETDTSPTKAPWALGGIITGTTTGLLIAHTLTRKDNP